MQISALVKKSAVAHCVPVGKVYKPGNVRITLCGAFVQPLLLWKCNKNNVLWVFVCSLWYPACNAHAPCYIVYGLSGYSVFFHIIS